MRICSSISNIQIICCPISQWNNWIIQRIFSKDNFSRSWFFGSEWRPVIWKILSCIWIVIVESWLGHVGPLLKVVRWKQDLVVNQILKFKCPLLGVVAEVAVKHWTLQLVSRFKRGCWVFRHVTHLDPAANAGLCELDEHQIVNLRCFDTASGALDASILLPMVQCVHVWNEDCLRVCSHRQVWRRKRGHTANWVQQASLVWAVVEESLQPRVWWKWFLGVAEVLNHCLNP